MYEHTGKMGEPRTAEEHSRCMVESAGSKGASRDAEEKGLGGGNGRGEGSVAKGSREGGELWRRQSGEGRGEARQRQRAEAKA